MRTFCIVLVFIAQLGYGQTPNLVDLGIANIRQETQVWCWAAVSQQIIYWKKGMAPNQCELVAISYNANPAVCCNNPAQCAITGDLNRIQGLLAHFGSSYSSIAPPASPDVLYNTLRSGRPIILALHFTPYTGHVVVLRGMDWVPTPYGLRPVLLINDPMSHFTQPVLFDDIIRFWRLAIVVQ